MVDLVKDFYGGKIADPTHVREWEKLTSDQEILNIIKGDKITFVSEPPSKNAARPCNVSEGKRKLMNVEIKEMLQLGIIRKTYHEEGEFLSSIFPEPKPDGRIRIILNLKELNGYIQYLHFKMDSIRTVLANVTEGCFMSSIDLKHAYYTIKMDEEYQKYLKFEWENELYQYTCFPNGLAPCPRKFTKVMKVPTSHLRQMGHFILGYIDDFFLKAKDKDKCFKAVRAAIELLHRLGFTIHPSKSQFEPSTVIVFLGFVIDSIEMTVTLTTEKKEKFLVLLKEVLSKTRVKIRMVASLVGKMVSSLPATLYGPLYYRNVEVNKNMALKKNCGNYEKYMYLSEDAKSDVRWWIKNVPTMYAPIQWPPITKEIFTDAAGKNGWGANIVGVPPIGGPWSEDQVDLHINVKEMVAILYGLRSFVDRLKGHHVRVMCDNTTAVFVLNKMGTSKSNECNEMAKQIWEFCKENDMFITSAHIPGVENVVADRASRKDYEQSEWMLCKDLFQQAVMHFDFIVDLDCFATQANTQVQNYISRYPDPFALYIDAFSINWRNRNVYLFPPFSLINRVLQKIRVDKATALCVVPKWTTQAWWSNLEELMIAGPLEIPPSPHNLVLPHKPNEVHPLHLKLNIVICLLSGKNTVQKGTEKKLLS